LSSVAERARALTALVDVEGDEHRWVVEADAIERFARAVGAPPRRDERGRMLAPATFLTRLVSADRPPWYEAMGHEHMLHATERLVVHRPVREGDELRWRSRISAVHERTGRDGRRLWFVDVRFPFCDARTGEPVAEIVRTRVVLDDPPEADA
jgi:hypothetical protein